MTNTEGVKSNKFKYKELCAKVLNIQRVAHFHWEIGGSDHSLLWCDISVKGEFKTRHKIQTDW